MSDRLDADVIIVGGGIVGVSTAMHLVQRNPGLDVLVLEKEAHLAAHQSGHNSGVIHAGVYYEPGSHKAQFCREGAAATYAFCERHGLPVQQCGKLIVATSDSEVAGLKDLYGRAQQNGLAPELLDARGLHQAEPRIVGRAAIRVSASGITDYPAITRKMASLAEQGGARFLFGIAVIGLAEEQASIVVASSKGEFRARHAILCGGLMADRLAAMCGIGLDFRILPFRGEYFRLPSSKDDIVNHLIYPVPNPDLPFLGVHLTRMIDGHVTVGPNAVLAFAREGYDWTSVNPKEMWEVARFPGFWKLAANHARWGCGEVWNSLWRRGYLKLCRRYCPELELEDLQPYPSGVRAQAVTAKGEMVHDFLIRRSKRSLHVCNAPSPAATSALPIGAHLAAEFARDFLGQHNERSSVMQPPHSSH